MVNLPDIELDNNTLNCYTNLKTCCRDSDSRLTGGPHGIFRFPDGNEVSSRASATSMIFSRNKQSLLLHRGNNATGPTGIYTCEIPDHDDMNQYVYFGVYNSNQGKK